MVNGARMRRLGLMLAAGLGSVGGGGGVAWGQTAQNACGSAQLIVTGTTYSGSTVGSTNDGSACVSETAPDVWYKYVPTAGEAGADVQVSLCTGTNYDSVVSIHTACGGPAIACNDDSCGTRSQLTFVPTAGQTYYIRVSGYQGATGTFGLRMSLPVPVVINIGPDVWVRELVDMQSYTYTSGTTPPGPLNGMHAFAVGTDACNKGDYWAEWVQNTNRHPVIGQNMYRLKNNRFEQVGQSWLKHGFLATNSPSCGTCQSTPNGTAQLGVNCSDTYGSGLNGQFGYLGPRSQVNATTGAFSWPHGSPSSSTRIAGRIQVPTAELETTGSRYFVDCQYVTADDAQWNRGLNNFTWREVNPATLFAQSQSFLSTGTTGQRQEKPAVYAWQLVDPTVKIRNADLTVANPTPTFTPPGGNTLPASVTTRFVVASKVVDLGGGLWRYEYAVMNINSDRSGGSFTVPLPASATVSQIYFHAPASHSGEPYSNAPWLSSRVGNTITFACEAFASNANANAIRWGTLYNFSFVSNAAPTTGDGVVGLFKPGAESGVTAAGIDVPTVPPSVCPADIVAVGGLPPADGLLTGDDFNAFINAFASGDLLADIVAIGGTPPGDGLITGDDFNAFIASFAAGCP
ncbi:MAG: hypothetical protein LW650_14695 [Planctomycetaceae bacterium]|nr:hypothetical protein [Planctomycetaceae bacterium]